MKKYEQYRKDIKNGDIVLFSRKGFLANIIRWADDAYYNHAGIAYWIGQRLYIIDAWDNGTELVPMSRRMNKYDDFCVIRKKNIEIPKLRKALNNLMDRIEKDEPYGYLELVRRLIWLKVLNKNNRFNNIENMISKRRKPVCSDVSRDFGVDLGIDSYINLILPTPEDLLRFGKDCDILWNDHSISINSTPNIL